MDPEGRNQDLFNRQIKWLDLSPEGKARMREAFEAIKKEEAGQRSCGFTSGLPGNWEFPNTKPDQE